MILFIVNQPLTEPPQLVSADDSVVLIENAVYTNISLPVRSVYTLDVDARARGVPGPTHSELIDHARFVELCTQHDKVVTL